MTRPSFLRLPALALLLTLLGGGLGLPLFDAVVFHSKPIAATEGTVVPEGAPAPHTALCILDHPGLLETSLVSTGHSSLVTPPAPALATGDVDTAPPATNSTLLPPSRAPPVV